MESLSALEIVGIIVLLVLFIRISVYVIRVIYKFMTNKYN